MKKIKPLVFICAGLMTIATLYGAIDLATSNNKDELKDLYVEKPEVERPTETIEKEKVEKTTAEVQQKQIVKHQQKLTRKKETKKRKKVGGKFIEKEVYNKPIEEVIEVTKEKDLEWESFSRKPINKKFKKVVVTHVDTVTKGSLAVTKD